MDDGAVAASGYIENSDPVVHRIAVKHNDSDVRIGSRGVDCHCWAMFALCIVGLGVRRDCFAAGNT